MASSVINMPQAKLQELYLKLSFTMANAVTPNVRLPDIIGSITRAQSSSYATKAMQEVSQVGQFVSNNSTSARFHENGILRYAQTVTELDVSFLEQIRDETAQGMDAFDLIASMDDTPSSKQVKLASFLLTVLERIAARLETYYSQLSQESIYRPEIENNPARTRWHNVRRKIVDGSFFLLAKPPSMASPALQTRPGQNGLGVDFAQIFASAQQTIQHSPASISPSTEKPQNRRLADMHTARAVPNTQAPSTFDMQQQGNALRRMSTFITDNMSTIRRLSKLPAEYDFEHLMATYGKQSSQAPSTSFPQIPTASPIMSNSIAGLRVRGTGSLSPLPAPTPLHIQTRTPSLERNVQLNHRHLPAQQRPLASPQTRPSISPTHSSASSTQTSQNAALNAAVAQLTRRQPPRSTTPLPASPRASLALSASSSRRKMSEASAPPMPEMPSVMRAMKMAASGDGDELKFQQVQGRV